MSITFLEAVLDGGIQNPNFFNGRVLTAQDLRDEQRASYQRAQRLGQALGEGVAYGLFVKPSGANLQVSAGLAINRRGDALLLPATETIALVGEAAVQAGSDSPFAPCAPPGTTPVGTINAGLYLLAITAATGLTGRAPTSSLNGTSMTCTSQYEVEGVQFKLITIGASDFTPTGAETTWRSLLAHACFGTPTLVPAAPNPFSMPPRYGLLDSLRGSGKLADCDVPLAVFRWLGSSIQFVDVWAARRPCAGVSALAEWPLPAVASSGGEQWSQHASERRRIEGQAMLLQFQAEIDTLRTTAGYAQATAATYFPFLPAAGYLPLPNLSTYPAWLQTFFALPAIPALPALDPAYLREYVNRSFYIDAIRVEANKPVPVDLFSVPGASPNRPYVVFVRREQLPIVIEPEEEEEEAPELEDATLIVAVVDQQGKPIPAGAVGSVTATAKGGQSYTGKLYKGRGSIGGQFGRGLFQMRTASQQRSTGSKDTVNVIELLDKLSGKVGKDTTEAVYIVTPLPPGKYTVRATPTTQIKGRVRSVSTVVALRSGETETVTLSFTAATKPGGTFGTLRPEDPWVLGQGVLIDKLYLDRDWREQQEPLTDTIPDVIQLKEWLVDPPRDVREQVEDLLAVWVDDDPTLASQSPQIYIRPDYTPGAVYDEPYAYIGTADGALYPAVVVPGDRALAGDVPTTLAGLPDVDVMTFNTRLRGSGLENIDAVAGAWTGLLQTTLGLGQAGAASLVGEVRGAAERLQGSFETYPGVDATASAALARVFADDVALANATPEAVLAALGGTEAGYSEGFALRLIDRARSIVPESAWSVAGLDLGANELAALDQLGVGSRAGLLALAEDSKGRDTLKQALGIDDAALNRLADRTQAGLVAGQLRRAPDKGVASISGISAARAQALSRAGLGTVAALANAERSAVAASLQISLAEAGELVERAISTSGAAIDKVPGLDADSVAALRAQGIRSVGDLARADESKLAGILSNEVLASRARSAADTIARRARLRPE